MKLSSFFGRFFGRTKHPQVIDRAELAEILQKIQSATIISLEALTYPRAKANGLVSKKQKVVGIFKWQYKRAVNNRRYMEGKKPNFEPEPRRWGGRLGNLIVHNDKLYCEVKVEKLCWEEYYIDGQPASLEEIELPQKKEGSRQNLDKPVIVRDFALESITKFKMLGKEFIVKEKLTRTKKKAFGKILRVNKQRERKGVVR